MPRISAAEARARIADIIADSIAEASDLKASLLDERGALENQDTDALHAVVHVKNSCARNLQRLERMRGELCNAWGFVDGPEQMQQVLDWCDEDEQLGRSWTRLIDIATEGNALNLTNGAIIRVRQQHMESSLSVLRGSSPGPDTYGQNGAEIGDSGRHSLAEA